MEKEGASHGRQVSAGSDQLRDGRLARRDRWPVRARQRALGLCARGRSFASTTLTSWAARVRANAHAPPGWAARRSRETAPTRSRMRTRVTFSPSAPESRRDIARAFSIRSSSWRLAVRIRHKIDHLGGVKTLPALPDGGQQPVNDGERRAQLRARACRIGSLPTAPIIANELAAPAWKPSSTDSSPPSGGWKRSRGQIQAPRATGERSPIAGSQSSSVAPSHLQPPLRSQRSGSHRSFRGACRPLARNPGRSAPRVNNRMAGRPLRRN